MGFLLFDLIFGKEDDEKKCTKCKGSGISPSYGKGTNGRTCNACNGSGLREDEIEEDWEEIAKESGIILWLTY